MAETWRHNLITIEFTEAAAETITVEDASVLTYTITARSNTLVSSSLVRTRGEETEAIDASNYTLDLASGELTLDASVVEVDDSFELSYRYLSHLRLWTGQDDLTLSGKTYRGGGAAQSVSEYENASGDPDKRMQISLSGIPTDLRSQFLKDAGPVPVTVEWISSQDLGSIWSKLPIAFKGRMSTPSMSVGVLTAELETQRGDVDRGRPLRWSHEDQQRRFTGDLGLEYMRALSQQGADTSWPP